MIAKLRSGDRAGCANDLSFSSYVRRICEKCFQAATTLCPLHKDHDESAELMSEMHVLVKSVNHKWKFENGVDCSVAIRGHSQFVIARASSARKSSPAEPEESSSSFVPKVNGYAGEGEGADAKESDGACRMTGPTCNSQHEQTRIRAAQRSVLVQHG